MEKPDWNPDNKKLREFGWFSLAGFGLMGLVFGWRFGWIKDGDWLFPGIFWGMGLLSAILALVAPLLLKPTYWLMTALSAILGPIVATLVLGILFSLVFLPIGVIFSLRGRDALRLSLNRKAVSYWLPADMPHEPKRYLHQH
ncbi:hypothetical protein HZ994_01620 [Akkermansiaceae bacterium]|nr:hypothetical protein HZ994_01620 [Akkermansiaceae bacterium]